MKTSRPVTPPPYQRRLLLITLVAGLYLLACDLPGQRVLSGPEVTATYNTLNTAVAATNQALHPGSPTAPAALTAAASSSPTNTIPPKNATATPSPAPANSATPTNTVPPAPTVPGAPAVTALDNANVREGPSTQFFTVGALLKGQSATILGKDGIAPWFYISFTAGRGGKGWIAASTVSTTGDLSSVPVLNSPPTYTPTPTNTPTRTPTPTKTATPTVTLTPTETATPTNTP
jgi:uncharacterized protein YgiM (DUF1202 family)